MRRLCIVVLASLSFCANGRAALPSNVTILTRAELHERDFFSVAEAVEEVPGVYLDKQGTTGARHRVFMRGVGEARAVEIFLNGQPLNPVFDGQVDLSQIPLSMVERIEVTRGGSSVSYGQPIAGSIHIITVRPQQKGLDVTLGTHVGRDGLKHHDGRFLARAFMGDITYTGSQLEKGGFSQHEGATGDYHYLNGSRSFQSGGYASADYLYSNIERGLSNGTPVAYSGWDGRHERAPVTPQAENEQNWQQAKLSLVRPLGSSRLHLDVLQMTRFTRDRIRKQGDVLDGDDHRSRMLTLRWTLGAFEAGAHTRQDRELNALFGTHNVEQHDVYAFLKRDVGVGLLVPGVRGSYHSKAGGAWMPRLAFVSHPWKKNTTFSFTAQRGYRYPSFEELFASPDPDPKPERASQADIGIEWSASDTFRTKWTPFGIRRHLLGGGKAFAYGAEWEAFYTRGRTSVEWNVTGQNARYKLNGRYVDAAFTPRWLSHVRWNQRLPRGLTLVNKVSYQASRTEFHDEQGATLPSYYKWDIRLLVKMGSARLYAGIDNVTARPIAGGLSQYDETGALDSSFLVPQPTRTFKLGITLRFLN